MTRIFLLMFIGVCLFSCTKEEDKIHRCWPLCDRVVLSGKVIDSVNNDIANIPFRASFVYNPPGFITLFPRKDQVICVFESDNNGEIIEELKIDRSMFNKNFSLYIAPISGPIGFYIDSLPTGPIKFVYYR